LYLKENVEAWLRGLENQIRDLVDEIPAIHFVRLTPGPQFKMCGSYQGRWYGRMLAASPTVSFKDGHCLSYDWFEHEEGFFCRLAQQCAAYRRKWPGGLKSVSGGDHLSPQPL
jgi:hypothetical protein